jgi:hypothetical protein
VSIGSARISGCRTDNQAILIAVQSTEIPHFLSIDSVRGVKGLGVEQEELYGNVIVDQHE